MDNLVKISINEERWFDGKVFPLSVSPNETIRTANESIQFVKNNLDSIRHELKKHGVILFRDFHIQSAQEFNDFALSFGWENLPYLGGAAVRNQVCGIVFTANEGPADIPVVFHHEMAHVPVYPNFLFFFCDQEPREGGETQFCLSNQVYEHVKREKPDFVEQLECKNLKYVRILPEEDDPGSLYGRGWKSTFLTSDKKEAEEKAQLNGGSYEWLPNNTMRVASKPMAALKVDFDSGLTTWFNSIVPFYCGVNDSKTHGKLVTFEDNTEIRQEDAEVCHEVMNRISVALKWKKGDVVLVDNRLALHARRTYLPPRRIYAALFK